MAPIALPVDAGDMVGDIMEAPVGGGAKAEPEVGGGEVNPTRLSSPDCWFVETGFGWTMLN